RTTLPLYFSPRFTFLPSSVSISRLSGARFAVFSVFEDAAPAACAVRGILNTPVKMSEATHTYFIASSPMEGMQYWPTQIIDQRRRAWYPPRPGQDGRAI